VDRKDSTPDFFPPVLKLQDRTGQWQGISRRQSETETLVHIVLMPRSALVA
jgi:hypothetical protein